LISAGTVFEPLGDSGDGCGGDFEFVGDLAVRKFEFEFLGDLPPFGHRLEFGGGAEIAKKFFAFFFGFERENCSEKLIGFAVEFEFF